MDILLDAAALLGPMIAGLLTVPVLQLLKRVSGLVDRSPAWLKQLLGVVIAYGITQLGAMLELVLPLDLNMFTGETVEALLAAAIAFGVHAGKRAKEATPASQAAYR